MSLTMQEVEHIAELARLALSNEEKNLFRTQLSAILDYAARLQAIDTDAISPTASVLPIDTVLREDVVHTGMSATEALANTEEKSDDMFRVRAVME